MDASTPAGGYENTRDKLVQRRKNYTKAGFFGNRILFEQPGTMAETENGMGIFIWSDNHITALRNHIKSKIIHKNLLKPVKLLF